MVSRHRMFILLIEIMKLFFLKRSSTLYTETTYSVSREAKMLSWLSEKLKVPELIMTFQDEQFELMITKAINAKPISALFFNRPRIACYL